MLKRFFATLVTALVFAGALLSTAVQAASITAGNLVIYRVGDGAAALAASGTAVFLDEYTPTGTLVQSIAVPTTTVSTNKRLVASGTSGTEGLITRSTDGRYVLLTGYDAGLATVSLTTSASTSVNRVIGRLDTSGALNTTTVLTDASSGASPRGAASTNGTDIWMSGGAGSVRYTTLGSTTSTQLSTTVTNMRGVAIYGGQLYTTTQSGTAIRVGSVGTGIPTASGQTIVNLPGFSTTSAPNSFFLADLDAGTTGVDTLYVADETAGQILKYSLVAGTWTSNGTITAASVRGLTASVSGSTVTLFVTYSAGSKFATVIDTAGYNAAPSTTTVTDRATASTNTAFRGIALAPSAGVATTMTANTSTTPQTATVSTAFTNALAVTLLDASSNPVSGVNVTFTAPGSGASGTFSNSTATITVATNASGIASAAFTANATAGGAYTVSATASGLTTVDFALTNTAGAATSMTTNSGTTPQTVTISSAFANALAVTVTDAGSNPVSGVNVTFTAPASGASGTFSNSTATITVATNASGIASAAFTANSTAGGPYNVVASASGLTTVNFSLTNAVGAATSMTANSGTTPQSAAISTAFANALAVTVRDAGNSPVPGVNVTFTAPGSGASGAFSNSTATITVASDASGIATATFTANTTTGGPYNVSAAATGLTTINFALTNTVGAAASMTANTGTTPQSMVISTAVANALAVTVRDAGSNLVPGVSVTFTAPGSGASGTFSNSTTTITVATNASGVASAPFTANTTAGGPYNVAAAATGVTTINFALTNTAGAATTMASNAGTTPQSASNSTAFANALAVTVRDAGSNPVSGVSVTFTSPATGASGTFSNSTATITVTTNASGVASATFTANTTAGGPYVVTAAASGLTSVSFALTNNAVVASTGDLVISQVYGGGGNTGAVYTNDFIEVFNRGVTPVNVAGWSVQYASATGTSWSVTNLTGTIAAGAYLLVQEAAGTGGTTALPTPNATGSIAMAGTAGKVALVSVTTALSGACPTTNVVDFVGYGTTANCFEGSGSTVAPSNTNSVIRAGNGCTDSNSNAADFTAVVAAPRNSASPLQSCSPFPGLSINDVQITEGNSGTSTLTFTVSLTAAAGVGGVTFDIATQDNTATAGSDYVAKALTAQTIPAGVTTYTFDVTINGDIAPEADETFYVNITNLSGANLVKGQGVGTIINDDAGVNLSINDVTLNEGNSGTTTFSFMVTLSGPAPAGGVTFDIATAPNTATAPSDYTTKSLTAQTIPAGMTTYSFDVLVNGDTTAEADETFHVNLTNISNAIPVKTRGVGTIINDDLYRIHEVQGNSTASPYAGGFVTVEGIVTEVFQGANSLNGFYIQEPDALADADPATSEAVFIYTNLVPAAVVVGDLVRVSGTVVEFGTAPNTLTEIVTPTVIVLSSGNPLPAVVDVTLPVAALTDLERYEGMRVRFVQTLTVSDHFDLARFGEVKLKANGRALQPTNVIDLNDDPASGTTSSGTSNLAAVNAYASLNVRSTIVLDDASSKTFPAVVPFIDPVDNTLRLGSTVDNLTGIFSQSFGTYRLYAATTPAFNYAPRPVTPPAVGGNVKVASANVLNYFNGDGLGGGFPTSRGANSLLEFNRQRAKTIAAINGLNADVVGLLEMENDGIGPNSALQDLVNGLNGVAGAGTWAIIADPAGYCCGNAGTTDAIRPAIIYKPAVVTTVGASSTIIDSAFNIGRAPVAQTFALVSNGEKFTLVMNHFKSKGSGGTGLDADNGDGQAFYNNTRKLQSQALLTFISTLSAASPRIITMGDFNAYEQEDPMDVLRAGGLATIINGDTSYMFAGLSGSLDHALGTAALMSVVSGSGHWHINADEPVFLDYNVETKNTVGCTSSCTTPDYYAATPFRASDHDPVLVGLQLNGAQCLAGNFSVNGFVPCTPASLGNFVSLNGATLQTPCAAGSFSDTSGASVCTQAGLGFFVATAQASTQTQCAAGTTTLMTGATSCVPITFTVTPSAGGNGSITPNVAQTVNIGTTTAFNISANPGFTASVTLGSGECGGTLSGATYTTVAITANCTVQATFAAIPVQCLAGTFSATGAAPCTPASPGSFVATAGATSQTSCIAGTFSSGSGTVTCSIATPGNYVAAPGSTSQTPASAGSFVSSSGASAQTQCAAGAFSPATGASACTPAALGFFVPLAGATAQTACATGTTTLTPGATVCVPITYTVTPIAGANGTISPSTPQTVAFGATTSFIVNANAGYSFSVTSGIGNCGGTVVGNTFSTVAILANCNVAVTFAVIPVVQTITGFQPPSPVNFGAAPITLTAVGGGSGNPIVFATTSPATVCTVAGATVSLTGVGTCNLTADQAGATGYVAAPQVTASIVIAQASQTINFNPPATLAFGTGSLSLTASASSGLPVSFASSTSATCTVNATTLTLITAGACIVTASQPGNANYRPATSVVRTITIGDNTSITPSEPAYRFGEIMNLTFVVTGNNPTGTVSFSTVDGVPIPGCTALPVVNGSAACIVPSSFSLLNTLPFVASYSGDSRNPPSVSYLSRQVQLDQAVLSTSVTPVNPIPAGSRATVSALVRMRAPVGTVSFYLPTTGAESPVAIPGCDALPLVLLATATNSAIANCSFNAPAAGNTNVVAVYRYPVGHVSNRIFEQEVQPITTIANAPPNYTDMWWAGANENGWGVSISQHGATQVNIIFTYDNSGKPIWYLMSGCTWNAGNTACTGDLFQPTSSPFSQYDVTRFQVNASVGSVTFTFKSFNTATMSYRINGVSGTKEIERQVFAGATNLPILAVNDLWWNGVAENGWGINVSQQGRQLFPVWFTYDASGRATFYFVPGGSWNGLVFTGDLYTATSSAWLGVPYDASKFVATKVGSMSIDFREANTATMTYTVGNLVQTKIIVRQPY